MKYKLITAVRLRRKEEMKKQTRFIAPLRNKVPVHRTKSMHRKVSEENFPTRFTGKVW